MRIHMTSKLTQLAIVTVSYVLILLAFRHFDLVIFTEIGIYVEKVKKSHSTLTQDQYSRAFHLDDKFRNSESNVILIWSAPFGIVKPIGNFEDGCVRTYDRTAISVAKAVVFHFAEIQDDPYWLPLHQRKASQRWIWLCLEPPTLTRGIFHKSLTPLNGIFNMTVTYRTDSDVTMTYRQNITQSNRSVEEMLQNKRSSSLGVWLVSNCKSTFRNNLIQKLQQYISIDVKGKCSGDVLCKGSCEIASVSRYKFVFTLENSRCEDYITEKFFKLGLKTEAVPVVLGPPRSSYEKYAPGGSFIHVDDFGSAEILAKYLRRLDENDNEYAEFLKYKSTRYPEYDIHAQPRVNVWESLCNIVRTDSLERKTINHLDTWWYGDLYNHEDKKSRISYCHQDDDGTSGEDFHIIFVYGYHLGVFVLFVVTCAFVFKSGDNRA